MKKIFHFAAIALVASALVACNSSNNTEDTTAPAQDSTAVDSIAMDDTTAVVDSIVEEPAQKAQPAKKADKKELKATNEAPATDANANAKNRLAGKQAENAGVKEATPAKDAPTTTPDVNQNAKNRLKR